MAAIDLCTLADVKTALPTPDNRDPAITLYITTASRRIMRYTGREFVSEATASTKRSFPYFGAAMVDLAPYDLRADLPYSLKLDAEDLVENTDFFLDPLPATSGVYERVVMFAMNGTMRRPLMAPMRSTVDVTGTWGFPSIPDEVRMAAIRTVISWLDRGTPADYSMAQDDARMIAPSAPAFDLPFAAKLMLDPFRRAGVS